MAQFVGINVLQLKNPWRYSTHKCVHQFYRSSLSADIYFWCLHMLTGDHNAWSRCIPANWTTLNGVSIEYAQPSPRFTDQMLPNWWQLPNIWIWVFFKLRWKSRRTRAYLRAAPSKADNSISESEKQMPGACYDQLYKMQGQISSFCFQLQGLLPWPIWLENTPWQISRSNFTFI